MLSDGPGIEDIALGLLDGQTPAGTQTAWSWTDSGMVLLARPVGTSGDTEVALVLDDAPEAVSAGIKDPWRGWLRLSNLLGLRPTGTEITVRSLIAGAPAPAPAGAATEAEPTEAAWKPIIEQSTPAEADFLRLLAREGLPAPEFGPEVDGIPLGPTWPEQKLTLDVDFEADERATLEADGWTVVEMDVDAVRQALAATGVS
jgi:hypothetical protein